MTPRTLGLSIAALLLLACSFAPPQALAEGNAWDISLTGGLGLPQGDFKDETEGLDAKSGPQGGIDICYHVSPTLAIGVDGSWNRNKHAGEGKTVDLGGGITETANKDRYNTIQYGVHGKYMIPTSGSLMPYGLLGLGFYNIKEDFEYTYDDGVMQQVFTDESEDIDQPGAKFGWKIGAGATYMTSPKFGIGLGVDYNSFSLDKDKYGVSSIPSINIRGRLTYRIMPN